MNNRSKQTRKTEKKTDSDYFLEEVVAKAVDQIMEKLQMPGSQRTKIGQIKGGWNQI